MFERKLEQVISSTAQEIVRKFSPIEIQSDELPDLVFSASDSIIADLYQSILDIDLTGIDGHIISTEGISISLETDKKNLITGEYDGDVYVIEHREYCITVLKNKNEIHFYQRYPRKN